jgi:hypothetical protein
MGYRHQTREKAEKSLFSLNRRGKRDNHTGTRQPTLFDIENPAELYLKNAMDFK